MNEFSFLVLEGLCEGGVGEINFKCIRNLPVTAEIKWMVQSLDGKEYKQQLGVTQGYREQLQLLDTEIGVRIVRVLVPCAINTPVIYEL